MPGLLAEISATVTTGAHAIMLMDQAGWHTTAQLKIPRNLSIVCIPPATPELNPVENVWQHLRQMVLGNRAFEDYDDIANRLCQAWRTLLRTPVGFNPSPIVTGLASLGVHDRW